MHIEKISIGKNPPSDINVMIEIPQGSGPIKYEFDKKAGVIEVDRFIGTSMVYPANYGFIPNTLSEDGDPADVLVLSPVPILAGAVVRARPIGVLKMEDEKGFDEKILAVPHDKITQQYSHILSYADLPHGICAAIEHFFTHYKDLEQGKWVKIAGWGDAAEAGDLILQAIKRDKAA